MSNNSYRPMRLSSTTSSDRVQCYVDTRNQQSTFSQPSTSTAVQLQDSGYQTLLMRSQTSPIGTCWMYSDSRSIASSRSSSSEEWDGYMNVGDEKMKIRDVCDLLSSKYACISGAKTPEGFPIMTFPDVRMQLSFLDYRRLVTYLVDVPPLEESHYGYVLVIDKRMDRWTSLKTLLSHIACFFPATVRLIFILKPEGVLQKALEIGYRRILDSYRFRTIVCQTVQELHLYIHPVLLTFDLCGTLKYNHLEWVQNRMDIERMRSSTQQIARNLADFDACVRETEMPNDVETTQTVLDAQRLERDAIKEDFRIALRKGFALLRNVRQPETKPNADQLSPTRLHNSTVVERLLVQLEETESNFDSFWADHEDKLKQCLQLRMFENNFKQLQMNFAMSMLRLEEHNRDVGDCAERAQALINEHMEYADVVEKDIVSAEQLRTEGEALIISDHYATDASIRPKCQELRRLADALSSALRRRLDVLNLSKTLHSQIYAANDWCSRGVSLLSEQPFDTSQDSLTSIRRLLDEAEELDLDTVDRSQSADLRHLVLMTTTDTSTLLQQVKARIDDVRAMCSRRVCDLEAWSDRAPLKQNQESPSLRSPDAPTHASRKSSRSSIQPSSPRRQIDVIYEVPSAATQGDSKMMMQESTEDAKQSKADYVIDELLTTEQCYVDELASVAKHYLMGGLRNGALEHLMPACLIDQETILFANWEEICEFHRDVFLQELRFAASSDEPADAIARCFLNRIDNFHMYHLYCQNKPRSEALRHRVGERNALFLECQRQAAHPLPLGAYLLKPVQRITKYQLLLKELSKTAPHSHVLSEAVQCMLALLNQLNASMYQANIVGYPKHLSDLGQMLLQGRFNVWHSSKAIESKTAGLPRLRRTSKWQQRHVFLFARAMIFCKQRTQQPPYTPQDYFEYKNELTLDDLHLSDPSPSAKNSGKFELYTANRADVFVLQPVESTSRTDWVQQLRELLGSSNGSLRPTNPRERPISWTSSTSSSGGSSRSSRDLSSNPDIAAVDRSGDANNNPSSPTSLPDDSRFVAAAEFSDSENNSMLRRTTTAPTSSAFHPTTPTSTPQHQSKRHSTPSTTLACSPTHLATAPTSLSNRNLQQLLPSN